MRCSDEDMIANLIRYLRGFATLLAALIAGAPVAVGGSLHMLDSTPTTDAIIHGRHAEYVIRFDGPADHIASRMEVVQADRVVQSLTPRGDSAVDVLFASGEAPPPGRYLLRWQVRSVVDRTVTEGSTSFLVAP
jgi:methionine-rich copper-binding protein CopC